MALECVTASTRPDLDEEASTAFRERWPEFVFHDPISRAYVDRVEQYFPQYQVLLLDDGRVAAGGWGSRSPTTVAPPTCPTATTAPSCAPSKATKRARCPQRSASWRRPSTMSTTSADGLSIDPWIRTHQRMGAQVVGVAPRSMVIPGTVAEWETWADMLFPESGEHVVPEALNLVRVDRENDSVVYEEENLWVRHDI
jgi:hypothetical protein